MDKTSRSNGILLIEPLGFPWKTQDPFLFCVYPADAYPEGNSSFGPAASLEGRRLGNDFEIKMAGGCTMASIFRASPFILIVGLRPLLLCEKELWIIPIHGAERAAIATEMFNG